MKRFIDSSFVALLIAWLMQVGAYGFVSYFTSGIISDGDEILWAATSFGFFSIMANLLFVQLPSAFVKKVFFRTNAIQFALISSAYGVAIFAAFFLLAFGFSFSKALQELSASSAINGFTYGLAFHLIWKPESPSK